MAPDDFENTEELEEYYFGEELPIEPTNPQIGYTPRRCDSSGTRDHKYYCGDCLETGRWLLKRIKQFKLSYNERLFMLLLCLNRSNYALPKPLLVIIIIELFRNIS